MIMIENGYDYPMAETGIGMKEDCRPDPEDMLQRCRKKIENIEKAKILLFALIDSPVRITFGNDNQSQPFLVALGSLEAQKYSTLKEEAEWLKEIDKE